MKAVIMAGGEGKRLKSVTGDAPKPMAPLLGRPMMEHIVELLRRHGITEICAALKYNPRPIMDYFGDGAAFGVHMEYRVEDAPLGTAGGVKNCAGFYGKDDFMVISGDAACDFDLTALMDAHRARRPAATLALYRDSEPLRYGLAVTDGEGLVRSFIEKPGWERVVTDLVNTGIYILSPRILRYVPQGVSYDFAKDLFPLLLELGEDILGVPMEGYWCDVGTPLSYYQCCVDALSGRLTLPKAVLPETARAPETHAEEPDGETLTVECQNRAKLMGALSARLMDMEADFTHGLTVRGRDFSVNFAPSPLKNAVRICAAAEKAETAKELAVSAEELVRALDLRLQ
ncbi:MAG: nucleotidyltransferase family protein [Oscillospiraceae bacterium]|nr:nucleotidyltransferase family protein [Oscillospiraceae bacterium]